jgi:hypothetical protein
LRSQRAGNNARTAVKRAENNAGTTADLRPDEAGRGRRSGREPARMIPWGFTDQGANVADDPAARRRWHSEAGPWN